MQQLRLYRYKDHIFKILWMRGRDNVKKSYGYAKVYSACGIKGSGKSAILETIATQYPKILDLYGSQDNEGLAWLRSPFKDSVLLIKDESIEVDCNCADVKNVSELTLKDIEKYRVVISCYSMYGDMHREYYQLRKVFNLFRKRKHWKPEEAWFVILREGGNILFSRIGYGVSQLQTKTEMIYTLRQMRHFGISLGLDTLRDKAIDINVRQLSDYNFFKRMGTKGLPPEVRFIYRRISPKSIRTMPVHKFVILTELGYYGAGTFECPPWHKKESEDLLSLFDIRTSRKEMPFEPGELSRQVGDHEHERIIRMKIEKDVSMGKLAELLDRSSGTIYKHIHKHNNAVHREGECGSCAKVGSKFSKVAVE